MCEWPMNGFLKKNYVNTVFGTVYPCAHCTHATHILMVNSTHTVNTIENILSLAIVRNKKRCKTKDKASKFTVCVCVLNFAHV